MKPIRRALIAIVHGLEVLGPAGFAIRDDFLLPVGLEAGRFLHALILARRPQLPGFSFDVGYAIANIADFSDAAHAVTSIIAQAPLLPVCH